MQYQGGSDSPGQPTATKLTLGLNLDLQLPPANRCRGCAGDKHTLMQDAQADSSGHELFMGTKVVDQGRIQICGKLHHLCQTHLPQDKPAGQGLTEPSQFIDVELFSLKGFAMIHDQLARIGRSDQVLPCWGGGDYHIPGLKQLEEQQGTCVEWVTRQEMKIEYGEGHVGLIL